MAVEGGRSGGAGTGSDAPGPREGEGEWEMIGSRSELTHLAGRQERILTPAAMGGAS
jgi:hypothetical protein